MKEENKAVCQLGDGSYILNENAPIDTLLSDTSEWLGHAWYLADEVARHLERLNTQDAQDIKNKLSTVRVFSRMSLQCVRLVRRRLVASEWERRSGGR